MLVAQSAAKAMDLYDGVSRASDQNTPMCRNQSMACRSL